MNKLYKVGSIHNELLLFMVESMAIHMSIIIKIMQFYTFYECCLNI